MPEIALPEPKARPLLRILVEAIVRREIREGRPETFLSYSEALKRMGHPARGRAGQQLAGQGLKELDLWTMQNVALPKIAALIVNKDTHRPSPQFAESHGHGNDPKWEEWWLKEANRAIHFDWAPFLLPADGDSGRVREDEEESEPGSVATFPAQRDHLALASTAGPWVATEQYIPGKVVAMGGIDAPYIELLPDAPPGRLRISATIEQLTGISCLFERVTVRVAAEEQLGSKRLRNARLLEFLPASREVDEDALARLWDKGRVAWREVGKASEWVEELRGHPVGEK